MSAASELHDTYGRIQEQIRDRLGEFERTWQMSGRRVFEEMAFCLCTPQSNAKSCFSAVTSLVSSQLLFSGTAPEIAEVLRTRVRFHNTKSRYIVNARELFSDRLGRLRIRAILNRHSAETTRNWLAANIPGLGYKEASHFLRNVGMGGNLAILDRHILRQLVIHGVIADIPSSLTATRYIELEERFRCFSRKLAIPMADLDLLFWFQETGEIFK